MSGTRSIDTSATAGPRSFATRLRFRFGAQREIHELTRDREREGRILDEAAVRLAPGPWQLAQLFRRRP